MYLQWDLILNAVGGALVGLTTSYTLSKVFLDVRRQTIFIISIGWAAVMAVTSLLLYGYLFEIDKNLDIFIGRFIAFLLTTAFVGSLLYWQISRLERK